MWPSSMQFQSPCRYQKNRWCNSVFICCQDGRIKLLVYVWSHLLAPIFRINWICRRDARSRVYWLPSVGGLLPPYHWHVYSAPIVWSLLKDVQLPNHRLLGIVLHIFMYRWKFRYTGLVLFSLDGSGYVWLIYMYWLCTLLWNYVY
jgi:hypothetical protein